MKIMEYICYIHVIYIRMYWECVCVCVCMCVCVCNYNFISVHVLGEILTE